MKNLNLIACISNDYGLGRDGDLLWHIPEDMQFFKHTTLDSIVVMGRKTFESIGYPLPHRENIVLSRSEVQNDGVKSFTSSENLIKYLRTQTKPVFIIGGASLYQMFIEQAENIFLTEVDNSKPADTYFPKFNKELFHRKVLQTGEQDGVKYQIVEYSRK